ncbi:MAG: GNAT family N-acetyltransferase [Pseudomonadota bacterium]
MMLREAVHGDIKRIVEMLADDALASGRENLMGDLKAYHTAFDAIAADPNNTLYVWDEEGVAMGCLQLTFLPGMSYQGSWIAQVEGVRVDRSMRGEGIGEEMMKAVVAKARERGCKYLQLMTNKRRGDAQRFYERLGFEMSHEGMKLAL